MVDVPKAWFEVSVEVPRSCSEAVANFLIENGSPGLQLEESNDTAVLTAYFTHAPVIDSLRQFSVAIGAAPSERVLQVRVRTIAEEDWADNWKRHFNPQCIGARLYVCPSWDCAPPAGRVAVIIDPGMAFGTGQHASTRGCLELLEHAVETQPVRRALDVGTGSGLLAIALAKLGVGEVWATDIDPAACAIATANAGLNGVRTQLHIASTFESTWGPFDLITANLFANILQELAPQLTRMLSPKGIVICSGLLVEDEQRVRTAYESLSCKLWERREEDSWVTLALRRRDMR
jgi:ribosomal protein L11 methyltransferase